MGSRHKTIYTKFMDILDEDVAVVWSGLVEAVRVHQMISGQLKHKLLVQNNVYFVNEL